MGHITIGGTPGAGKTTLAKSLAELLGMRYYSAGSIHRQLAVETGVSSLDLNFTAETVLSIDDAIDDRTRQLALGRPTVFDSRMAWSIVDPEHTIYLSCTADVAAIRLMERNVAAERFGDAASAKQAIVDTVQSERRRFLTKYGLDIHEPLNYDLHLDTSYRTTEDCLETVVEDLGL